MKKFGSFGKRKFKIRCTYYEIYFSLIGLMSELSYFSFLEYTHSCEFFCYIIKFVVKSSVELLRA